MPLERAATPARLPPFIPPLPFARGGWSVSLEAWDGSLLGDDLRHVSCRRPRGEVVLCQVAFIGSFLVMLYAGIGLFGLPLSMINAYRLRPHYISKDQYARPLGTHSCPPAHLARTQPRALLGPTCMRRAALATRAVGRSVDRRRRAGL